jgi:hypothetical protein
MQAFQRPSPRLGRARPARRGVPAVGPTLPARRLRIAQAGFVDTFFPVFIGFFAYFFVFILTGVSFLRGRWRDPRAAARDLSRAEIVQA